MHEDLTLPTVTSATGNIVRVLLMMSLACFSGEYSSSTETQIVSVTST
jgi:hypothetical protein